MVNFQDNANFIWQVADDLLRGAFKQHEYGEVILPFVVLRRLDCVLEDCKDAVIDTNKKFKDKKLPDMTGILIKATQTANNPGGLNFYNTSFYDLRRLAQDAQSVEINFWNYINGYDNKVREIIDNFRLDRIVEKLVKNDYLFQLIDKFTEIDLHPDKVSNHQMGYIFEELLRRFSEMSNETAGEHYTPREVIHLMVNIMFAEHTDELKGKGIIRSVYDPACGTGGMLTIAKEHIQKHINSKVEVVMYGQELNEQTYAIAKSDVLIMGEEADNIKPDSSFSDDHFQGKKFDYMLSNPPFGVSWKKEQGFIKNESNNPLGRFAAGLPRISDGALLFLLHMISKMEDKGSRIAIIHNGSPLFTGDAGSGENNIRKWIIENDWLEAIIALPTELFYNTGIATYIWIVSNKKPQNRKGKVQLINAVGFAKKMRKSLGNKRNYITDDQIQQITDIYKSYQDGENCKIFGNADFGYTKVMVERPLVENGNIVKDKQGKPKPDTKLRDYEKIPLKQDIDEYFQKEVLPHISDAWMDRSKDKIGYEINFTKYFYKYKPLRPLADIKAEILALENETEGFLKEILD
jgi:type I restriction enzyme M protein